MKKEEITNRENLIGIGFYYKNDRPGGIGLVIHKDGYNDPREIQSMCELHHFNLLSIIKREGYQKVVDRLFHQIQVVGRTSIEDRSTLDMGIAMTNIYSLSLLGEIEDDEFNGMLCMYAH